MNKILILQIGLVMAIMFGVLGCSAVLTEDNDNELDWKKGQKATEQKQIITRPAGYGWSKKTYDGHTYIFVGGWGFKSDCIVHDPDCPCSKK
jgi:hypothetical protein